MVHTRARPGRAQGQSGVEFLAVTGIGLLMIVTISIFILGQTESERDESSLQQAQQIQSTLSAQAQEVWARGRNSWSTVDVVLPSTTKNITVVEGNTLVFDMSTSYAGIVAQPYFIPVPIAGNYTIDAQGRTAVFPPGLERGGSIPIRVANNGTAVVFSIQ